MNDGVKYTSYTHISFKNVFSVVIYATFMTFIEHDVIYHALPRNLKLISNLPELRLKNAWPLSLDAHVKLPYAAFEWMPSGRYLALRRAFAFLDAFSIFFIGNAFYS